MVPMCTICAPLIRICFYFMRKILYLTFTNLLYDLIDLFNDTSQYLGDMFTIDYPEFEKHIPDIYPTELQLNKANTSEKETSFH